MLLKYCFLFLFISFFSLTVFAQPTISSFSPASGPVGTTVTITGTNFSATPANNIVYFGAVKANVTAATASVLTVTAPLGATYQPITVTVNGLTGYSFKPFILTFANGGNINSTSFDDKIDFSTDLHPNGIAISDFDGDGKSDFATPNNYSISGQPASVSVLRNTSASGTISFAPRMDMINGSITYAIASGDLDGDGKPDIVSSSVTDQNISVFRNTSVVGTLSFAPKINFSTGTSPLSIAIADIDGDGKPDIAVVNSTANSISLYRNTSSIGAVSFAPKVDFITALNPKVLAVGDLDGDGKPDITVTNKFSYSFSLFRNISTPGNISLNARVDITCGTNNQPEGLAVADLDGDNKLDLAVVISQNATGSSFAQLYRNTSTIGNFSFSFNTSITGGNVTSYHIAAGDINGDSKPDLVLGVTDAGMAKVFQNFSVTPSFSFSESAQLLSFGPYAIGIGDFDGDSRPEVSTTDFTGDKVSVYKNRCGFPGITSFTPTTAGTGATVIITGNNFTGTTSVTFGGVTASSFTVVNSTTITAVVGTGATGDVVVTTSIGSGSKSGFIFAAPPTITSFTPSSGGNGTTITITGSNFIGSTAVSFGGVSATSFTVVNGTTITAVVGVGASGSVSVTNPFGTGSLPGFIFIPAPVVTSFTPTSGGTGTIVSITGSNFTGATAVSFGGVPAASFTVNTSTSITATVGVGGTGNVSVTTAGGTGSLGTYIFPPHSISSISPQTANVGTVITINGVGFSPTAINNIVYFGAVRANVITASSTQLTATVPIGATYSPVSVTINNLTAYSNQNFIPSFSGGAPLNDNSFVKVFDSVMTNLVTKFIVGDYDGDAKVDLGILNVNFRVYRNLSTINTIAFGPRQEFTVGTAPFGGAAADFDGDGKLDIVASNFSSGNISILKNISVPGTINFNPKIDLSMGSGDPDQLVVADFDMDGKPDIVVSVRNPNKLSVFRNTSAGNVISFANRIDLSLSLPPSRLAAGDLDGDSMPDVVYSDATTSANLHILRNISSISLVSFAPVIDIAVTSGSVWLVVGDLDNDNKPEIAAKPDFSSGLTVLRNTSITGNISFASGINYSVDNNAGEVAIGDMEGDGKPDLIASGDISVSVLKNISTPGIINFDLKKSYDGGGSYIINGADLNGDGKTDILTSPVFGTGKFTFIKNQVGGPNILSFSPTSAAQGATITITGIGFTGATAVSFGGVAAASFTVVNSATITAVLGTGASGNVVVTTPAGTAIRSGFVFIAPPVITSFNPTSGTTFTTVTITGNNFTGATAVSFGGVPASSFGVSSATQINATVGAGASGNVSVTTPAGTASLAGFTYIPAPTISSFTPTSGTSGTTVTITGTNFTGATIVRFGGINALSFTVVNSTTITAVVASGASGSVSVTTPGGSANLSGFTYIPPAPTITSFTPTSASSGATITIIGTTFTGATSLSFGGVAAASFIVVNSTTITAVVGAGATGIVSVTTPGGTASLAGFTYTVVTAVGDPNRNNSKELLISPNPASDKILIKHPASTRNSYLKLIDMDGRTVKLVTVGRNVIQTSLSVKGLVSGIYKLIWTDEKRTYRRTLMVSQ